MIRRERNRRHRLAGRGAAFGALLCLAFGARAAEFGAPAKFTNGAVKYQLSRTASSVMAVDSSGELHLAYWSGRISTTPVTPSFVYYRSWTRAGGWGAQQSIDNSVVGPDHIGGRHPTLALTDAGIWVLWQDHRHCTAGGNWIDNTEIYGDFLPTGGSFSASDARFTTTSAAHTGDNAYTPKLIRHPSGRMSFAWYDYHANARVSDVYVNTSDTSGTFTLGGAISAFQITHAPSRGGDPEYTLPDVALDAAETRHMVWTGGEGGGVDLFYAELPIGATATTEANLADGGTDFFDPPHIDVGLNGDVWIAYSDDASPAGEDIVLLRRRAGEAGFDDPIRVTTDSEREQYPDLEIDAQGRVHLVWVDERSGVHVYYGVYDPEAGTLTQEKQLTAQTDNWVRPTLLLREPSELYVVFEESNGIATGDLWFARGEIPASAGRWEAYP